MRNNMKHYITKYKDGGVQYAESWIQVRFFGKTLYLSRKRIAIK
jgi:hypothetical protein